MLNYIDDHIEKIQFTPGGTLCQVFGDAEGASCSVALVSMDENNEGLKHYHDNITEIYVFNKGEGVIIINGHEHSVSNGDCFIIPPNNTHYIKAISDMEFCCICTPPWSEEHEFVVEEMAVANDISKLDGYGIIHKLSEKENHEVRRIKTDSEFKLNEDEKTFRRVYYFTSGEGTINIDGEISEIQAGFCYEIKEGSNEVILPKGDLEFICVLDILK